VPPEHWPGATWHWLGAVLHVTFAQGSLLQSPVLELHPALQLVSVSV
jgi:hypothetical protein